MLTPLSCHCRHYAFADAEPLYYCRLITPASAMPRHDATLVFHSLSFAFLCHSFLLSLMPFIYFLSWLFRHTISPFHTFYAIALFHDAMPLA